MSLRFHYRDFNEDADPNAEIIEFLPNYATGLAYEINRQLIGSHGNDYSFKTIKSIDFAPSFHNCKFTNDNKGSFSGCDSVKTYSHLEYLNIEDMTNLSRMFEGNGALESLDLSSLNTSKIEDMGFMFKDCKNLKHINLSSSFNTSSATTFAYMFNGCTSLEELDLSSFDTSNATYFTYMFRDCRSLTKLNLTSFNTSKAKQFISMFERTFALKELDLSSFDTSNGVNFSDMFYNSRAPLNLIVSDNFVVNENAISTDMFGDNHGREDANYVNGRLRKKVGMLGSQPLGAYGNPLTILQLLDLTDGRDLTLYEPVKITAGTYSREMTNRWGTLCLPYAIDPTNSYNTCLFYGIESIGDVLTLKEITSTIDAGTPVVFCRKAGADKAVVNADYRKVLAIEPANATEGDRLVGTYQTKVLDAGNYFIANDAFRRVADTDKIKVAAYRAYIVKADDSTAPAAYNINMGSETTGIDATETIDDLNNAQAEYYTPDGRRINELQRGLNIVKVGKKVRKVLVK